ncbi:MAG TPA: Maf family protein, partial [Anaerovoracaceae bacterium]|nr:Maf family protein [Anaerovoracaceae bacterium]
MKDKTIILASSSPRRIEMLRRNGINPVIILPNIDESSHEQTQPNHLVMELAFKKAESVVPEAKQRFPNKNCLIIGADTIVYLETVIGKPKDKEDAFNILSKLRGKEHFVATGVAIIEIPSNLKKVFYEITKVRFKNYTDDDIHTYIDSKEPYDKAGGYAIQGIWGNNVEYISGDFNNVVGFPWNRIRKELYDKKNGWSCL